ncbi:MAG: damage-inducible protein DinB [Rhodospirillaceae bacterium]|nr:damage-inducible protein DinB [Rhodospirillaceae bacterium]
MKPHFAMFAAYNRWANQRLYAIVARVTELDYRRDLGAFFGSLHGTLNHILVGDRAWMRRLTGEGPTPSSLSEILYDDFSELRAARDAEDLRIIAYIDSLDEAAFARTLAYASMNGERHEQPVAQVLAHVFNHQTHHRGQAHGLITQLGHAAPALDLLYFLRQAIPE